MTSVVIYEGDREGGNAFLSYPNENRFEFIRETNPSELAARIPKDAVVLIAAVVQEDRTVPPGTNENIIPDLIVAHGRESRTPEAYRVAARVERGRPVASTRSYILLSVDEEIAEAFGDRKIIPTPLAYPRDGTYLAVRFDSVELVHIQNGALAGFGIVNVAGISSVTSEDQIDGYAVLVAEGVSTVMRDSIMAKSIEVERITIHGVGAGFPKIAQRISNELAITVQRPEGAPPVGDNTVQYGGWQGCQLTAEFVPQPEAFAMNAKAMADAAAKSSKRQQTLMRTGFAVIAVLLLAVAFVPWISAKRSLSGAKEDYASRVQEFSAVVENDLVLHQRTEGQFLVAGLSPAEVDWSSVIGWLLIDTPPQGTQWTAVQLSRSDVALRGGRTTGTDGPLSVLLTGQASVGGLSFEELSLWLDQLELSGLQSAWLDNFTRIEGDSTLQADGSVVDGRTTGSLADIRINTGYIPPIFPTAELPPEAIEPQVNEPQPTGENAPTTSPPLVPATDEAGTPSEETTLNEGTNGEETP